ncbi:MAG: 6-carboxytetrahydropterin synthase [Candidatus Omnitrophica bacterium]|nr:6-carboxytetrahydropterin synthase [Candidatus Omnitrophota bacterium]
MYSVTKIIHFCYGHRLLNYAGKCRYLHGHNGKVEIELSSERLDRRGMVRDFTEIKQAIQTWIDRELDHKMVLSRRDPVLPLLRRAGEPLFVIDHNPTAETLARIIFEYAASQNFPVTAVRLWETEHSVAAYRPPAADLRRRVRRAGAGRRRARGAIRSTSTAA